MSSQHPPTGSGASATAFDANQTPTSRERGPNQAHSKAPSELGGDKPGPVSVALEELYRFREIAVSPAMREELLHAKLPLVPPEQLLDTRPPGQGPTGRIDRGAITQPTLEGPVPTTIRDHGAQARVVSGMRRRHERARYFVAALLTALALLALVGLVLRLSRPAAHTQQMSQPPSISRGHANSKISAATPDREQAKPDPDTASTTHRVPASAPDVSRAQGTVPSAAGAAQAPRPGKSGASPSGRGAFNPERLIF